MEIIVSKILEILKSNSDMVNKEKTIGLVLNNLCEAVMTETFQRLDKELKPIYVAKGWKRLRSDEREIQGFFGCLTVRRSLFKDLSGVAHYPLDEALGLRPRVKYTPSFCLKIAQLAAKTPLRTVELAVELLTNMHITHQTVSKIKNDVGECCQEYEIKQAEETIELEKQEKPPVLHIEGDGVVIKKQHSNEEMQIHRLQIFEGSERIGKRTYLCNNHCFSGISREEVFEQARFYIENRYNLTDTIVIANSDNGSGYQESDFKDLILESKRFEFFIDRYHVNKKIKQRLGWAGNDIQTELRKKLWAYKKEDIETVITTALAMCEEKPQEEHVVELRNYITRNWEALKPRHSRKLKDIKGLGVCESGHRIYTYRMKKQGRSWSSKGAKAMCAIITAMKNNELETAMCECWQNFGKKANRILKKAAGQARKKLKIAHSIGARRGIIANFGPSSSPIGSLARAVDYCKI